jgi:type II secretory pathway component PulF
METKRGTRLLSILLWTALGLPLLLIFTMVFLVPIFANLFGGFGIDLPIPTRIVAHLSPYDWVYLAGVLLLAVVIVARKR